MLGALIAIYLFQKPKTILAAPSLASKSHLKDNRSDRDTPSASTAAEETTALEVTLPRLLKSSRGGGSDAVGQMSSATGKTLGQKQCLLSLSVVFVLLNILY